MEEKGRKALGEKGSWILQGMLHESLGSNWALIIHEGGELKKVQEKRALRGI